jgi:hypothetical protein
MKTPWVITIAVVALVIGFVLGVHHARTHPKFIYGTYDQMATRTNIVTGKTQITLGGGWRPFENQPVELQR